MKLFLSRYGGALILSVVICGVLCAASLWARPIFPIDETRYMTVAWEMKQSGNYLVPSLNQEVYHHKPPVLFWLINLMWAIFGVSQSAAMVVPYLASFCLLMLTARLARRLYPQHPDAPLLAVALLGGSLPFVIYANLIMFDVLLSVLVVLGITAIWDFVKWDSGRSGRSIHILILGAAIGIGILTKGPVMLLHLSFVLLGIKFWHDANEKYEESEKAQELAAPRAYFKSFAAAFILGVLIALCWAIPAAIYGGKEFADKIFWGQTAGRVVNAFDHQRPFYWYLTFVPMFILPWALSPALWRGARNFFASKISQDTVVKRFLLIWIIPVFVAFSLISGKQIHYLVPLLPAVSLLMAGFFLHHSRPLGQVDIWAILAVVALLCSVPVIMNFYADQIGAAIHGSVHIEETFAKSNPIVPMAVMMVIVMCGWIAGYLAKSLVPPLSARPLSYPLALIALSMAVMMAGFMGAAKNGFLINYDLAPIAVKLQEFDHQGAAPPLANSQEVIDLRPIAAAQIYHGEFGFLARLTRPIEQIGVKDIADWLARHPNGLVVYRTKDLKNYAPYHILYQQPYALSGYYAILEQSSPPSP